MAGCAVGVAPALVNVTPVVYMYGWAETDGPVASACSSLDTHPTTLAIIPTGVCAPMAANVDGQIRSMEVTSTAANDFRVSMYIGVGDCGGSAAYVRNGTLGVTCYSSTSSATSTVVPQEAFSGLATRLPTPSTVLQCSSAGCQNASASISTGGTGPAYIYLFSASITGCAVASVSPEYLLILETGVCVPTVDLVRRRVVSTRVTITDSGAYAYQSFSGVVDCSGAPTFAINGTVGDHCILDESYVLLTTGTFYSPRTRDAALPARQCGSSTYSHRASVVSGAGSPRRPRCSSCVE